MAEPLLVDVVCEGITPLLMHKDDVEAADELEAWRKDPKNKKVSKPGDDRSPAWTWMAYLYHDKEHLCLPTENVMSCLKSAGARVTLKGNKTFKESTQSGFWIASQNCKLLVAGKQVPIRPIEALKKLTYKEQAEAVRGMDFQLWPKRARVGSKKHVRVRPRFETWAVELTLEVSDLAPELTFDIACEIWKQAGRIGFADWRPGGPSPGTYGMFTATVKRRE